MIAALRLLPVLLRRAPRQALGAAALCAAGVAVAALVASTVVAAYVGLDAREERLVWREPTPAPMQGATGLQRRSLELFEAQKIDRVDLAPVDAHADRDRIPVPPGLASVPAPGTAVVSPALAELIASVAPAELGDRFGRVVGIIGDDGLTHPDELVAVVGSTSEHLGPIPDELTDLGPMFRMPGEPSPVTPIDSYDLTRVDDDLQMYRYLALVAVVLVSVPALMLVGSAARLTAARRELRLAAIRLAGGTPGAVRALAAAETALGATVGAVIGVGISLVVAPLLHGVEMAGGRWFTDDLRLGGVHAVAIALAASLVSVLAAVFSLRRVTSAPLGVARSADPQRARWPRVLGVVVAFAALALSSVLASRGGSVPMMIAVLAGVIGSLGLVGPWICSVIGRSIARSSRRPSTLIAGRRIVDDPKAAYRVVSAVVLAGLLAGFLAGVLPTAEARGALQGDPRQLSLTTTAEGAAEFERATAEQFPGTQVMTVNDWIGDDGIRMVDLAVEAAPGASTEVLRTATTELRGGSALLAATDDVYGDQALLGDIRRASLAILSAGLILAAASSAVAAAASIVDQRRTISRLVLSGMPVAMLQRARRWQSTVPLVAATLGALLVGVGSGITLMIGFGQNAGEIVGPQALQLLAAVVGAALIGLVSAAVTRPLLVAAARSGSDSAPA